MEPQHERAVLGRLVAAEAERDPDRLVVIFEDGPRAAERLTAADLAMRGNQLAWRLHRDGIGRDDRVGIMLRNHPEFLYGMVANSKLGVPTVPIDPRARGEKLRYFIEFAECSALIVEDSVVADEAAAELISSTGTRAYVVSTAEGRERGIDVTGDWETVNEAIEGPERKDVGQQVDDLSRPWLLSYTSGTTGDPKAIQFGYDRMPFYEQIPRFFGYRPDDVPYTGLSLIHGNALVVTLMPAIWGAVDHSVFSRWFTKTRLWDICAEHGCTTWSNLGGIIGAIYGEPPSPKDREHPVRLVVSAGCPREIWQPFEERFGVRILEWYGTMEGGLAYKPVGKGPVGSFGKPPDGLIEMDVVDEDGNSVPPGQLGELITRPAGRDAALEYFKNPEASARKVRGGWMYTGDMCWRDEDGWYFFGHRKEEGGLRKLGEFISEGFIRRVILEHSDVRDVHVYGVPAAGGAPGEKDIVVAMVVRDPETFDARAVFEHCAAQLERSHVPDFLQVVEELPKTATEKVQTRFLIEALQTRRSVYKREGSGATADASQR
jgi:acyl-CoA synthetase (AMP-forming)/AMP-acid ligase II